MPQHLTLDSFKTHALIVVEFAANRRLAKRIYNTFYKRQISPRGYVRRMKMVSAIFVKHLDVHVFDARKGYVALDQMDGLLLTGGSDAR